MRKPVVSTQETTGFSIRNRWFPPCVLSTIPRTVFATPRTVICQSIILSVILYLSYPQWFIFKNDRLTDFFAKSIFGYICSKMITGRRTNRAGSVAMARGCVKIGTSSFCCTFARRDERPRLRRLKDGRAMPSAYGISSALTRNSALLILLLTNKVNLC